MVAAGARATARGSAERGTPAVAGMRTTILQSLGSKGDLGPLGPNLLFFECGFTFILKNMCFFGVLV